MSCLLGGHAARCGTLPPPMPRLALPSRSLRPSPLRLPPLSRDYLWRVGEDEEEPSLDEVPVDALPLPDASPPGPLPAVPELGDWLTPTKPSDQFDLGMLIGGHPDAVGLSWTHDPETGQMVKRIIMRGERPSW